MTRELILYTAKECGLCAEMQEDLHTLLRGTAIECCAVDIGDDPELQHRYGARIPVLVSGNQEICELKLDKKALLSFINADHSAPPVTR